MIPVAELGRYALYVPLGIGGHAAVHLGVARGREPVPVAIKRLHDQFAHSPKAVGRLYDEVRLARQVQHPNAVRVLELVSDGDDTLAVFEYVHGEPLSRLLRETREAQARVPLPIAAAIAYDALLGLHAAHNAKSPEGTPLELVHRDVGPENILVGADGVARITDFGIAKAAGRMNSTRDGGIRGKLVYLAPEQVGGNVDRRTDVYAVGLTLWEMLTGQRLLDAEHEAAIVAKALDPRTAPPSTLNPEVSAELDAIVMKALAKRPDDRFRTASSFAAALQRALPIAEPQVVSDWVTQLGGARLNQRWDQLQQMIAAERLGPPARGPDTLDAATVSEARAEGRSRSTAIAWTATGIALAFAVYARIQAPAPAAPAPASPAPEPIASAPVAPPPAPVPVPDFEAEPSIAEPRGAAPISEAEAPAKTTPKPASKTVRTPRVTPPATPAECDPPTYIDAKGIKRYKPACVK